MHKPLTRQEILDLYFVEARHKLIDIGAFLDRVARADGDDDFRMAAFHCALAELTTREPHAAQRILLAFSDPTDEPIPAALTKAACGAWPGAV
ncbi:MAG: hypothetical protein NTV46_13970 [Verrucomicrobia bacterium]|nr:hypothetical protein [Verrucomicrobiota bacterium]